MTKDLLWEIGLEEVPARFLPPVIKQMKELATASLAEAGLTYEKLDVYATPRRLALLITALAEKAADTESEAKGPAVKAAYDAEGNPSRALQGFCRSQGVDPADVLQKEINGNLYIYVVKKVMGRMAVEILPELLPSLADRLYFPKPQRWGYNSKKFIRPIRWMVCLFGADVLALEYAGVKADRFSRGHRVLGSDHIELAAPADYIEALRKNYVMVDQAERRAVCWQQIQAVAASLDGEVRPDEELLEEVTFILEWPTALAGRFDEKYLAVPAELVVTPMREHQRYFPVYNKDGGLLPNFITVRNGDDRFLNVVAEGNEKVLRARLADAEFFYVEDRKDDMGENVEKLSTVVFHEKLGTSRQKVDRIMALADEIGKALGYNDAELAATKRAAYLAKSDLESRVVYEFPELQGIIGEYYANAAGEDAHVAQAIREHYLPRFAGDDLPETKAGTAVALADKLDSLCCFFAIGMIPSGSQDPYALRRAAAGCAQIIVNGELELALPALLPAAFTRVAEDAPGITDEQKAALDEAQVKLIAFLRQRLENILSEQGVAYDVINAVQDVAASTADLFGVYRRAMAIHAYRNDEGFRTLLAGFTRAANILRSAAQKKILPAAAVDAALFREAAEGGLNEAVNMAHAAAEPLLAAGDFAAVLAEAAKLTPCIDAFFEAVMVMDEDEAVRGNRLALLSALTGITAGVGDLSCIVD